MAIVRDEDKARAKLVAALVRKHGKLSTSQIMDALGCNLSRAALACRHARREGMIECQRSLERQWWATKAVAAQLRAEASAWRRVYNSRSYQKRRAAGIVDGNNRITDPPDWEITRRIVKAGTVPPPPTTAPSSAFTWRPA